MDQTVRRYHQLKQKQKEIEQELAELRQQIMNHCTDQGLTEFEIGNYSVKIIAQDRREYDEHKLYRALPALWWKISKADSSKISSMLKLNDITEDDLQGTYTMKKVSLLHVDRK
ncbi:hypothetical protein [Cohnella kolymensis]|uniref:hypothetical protein n=1 Tax=Cohnella kolymensis TaxID=1590652 RepID=UPI000B0F4DCD|nr:hypothetical protein [Cohnella kolymensis]